MERDFERLLIADIRGKNSSLRLYDMLARSSLSKKLSSVCITVSIGRKTLLVHTKYQSVTQRSQRKLATLIQVRRERMKFHSAVFLEKVPGFIRIFTILRLFAIFDVNIFVSSFPEFDT